MTAEKKTPVLQQRLWTLRQRRREIMALPSDKALDAIVSSTDALPLVHSFAEEDLYFLIKDIGPEDAAPLLSLASEKQWEYMLDLEIWQKDLLKTDLLLYWLELFMNADRHRSVYWLRTEKGELLKYCLFNHIVVRVREHDEDPTDFGDDFLTFDDVYYVKFMEKSGSESAPISEAEEHRREVLREMLQRLAESDYEKYVSLLWEAAAVLPAETEEELYRLRNVRLAEKGLFPFEEAVGIYQPLSVAETEDLKTQYRAPAVDSLPVPFYPVGLMPTRGIFAEAFGALDDEEARLRIQTELAVTCNQVVAADARTVEGREALASVVEKVCGYCNIGLQRVAESEDVTLKEAVKYLQTIHVNRLFRLGYDLAVRLKLDAEKWRQSSWYSRNGLPMSFWGELWTGVLGGLFIKRPLFYAAGGAGHLYREFTGLSDVNKTQATLDDIRGLDGLLSKMSLVLPERRSVLLNYQSLLLTLWARNSLGLPKAVEAISLEAFKPFFKSLFGYEVETHKHEEKTGAQGAGQKGLISQHSREQFLGWICRESGLSVETASSAYGRIFEGMFRSLEKENGQVRPRDLDPRYILFFLVK